MRFGWRVYVRGKPSRQYDEFLVGAFVFSVPTINATLLIRRISSYQARIIKPSSMVLYIQVCKGSMFCMRLLMLVK